MTINTGAIAKALWPGLNEIFGLSYNEIPAEYLEIFDKYTSTKNWEEDVGMYGTGLLSTKPEGTAIQYDTMAQWIYKRYVHITYALGWVITREAVEDNQYPELANQMATRLGFSARQTLETLGANVLNLGFSNTQLGGDGVALFSTAHVLGKGGTYANKLTVDADLSETSLEQALIDIGGFVDDAGNRIAARGTKLIIPRQYEYEAKRILGSDKQNDTANNALNAVKGILPYYVNHYLTDADAWFVKTNVANGMKYFERRPVSLQNDTPEFDTDNMKYKVDMRCSFGWTDPRGIYGSAGA
jgi:hypothetical protein